jgi:hypothetical protein
MTVLAARFMRLFPPRVNHAAFSDFDHAIARTKTDLCGGLKKIDMCPLITMVVNLIRYFTEQNSFRAPDAVSFRNERRVHEREIKSLLFW